MVAAALGDLRRHLLLKVHWQNVRLTLCGKNCRALGVRGALTVGAEAERFLIVTQIYIGGLLLGQAAATLLLHKLLMLLVLLVLSERIVCARGRLSRHVETQPSDRALVRVFSEVLPVGLALVEQSLPILVKHRVLSPFAEGGFPLVVRALVRLVRLLATARHDPGDLVHRKLLLGLLRWSLRHFRRQLLRCGKGVA